MALLVNQNPTSCAYVEFRQLGSFVGYCELVDGVTLSGDLTVEFDGTTLTAQIDRSHTFAETTKVWFSSHPIKKSCSPITLKNCSLKTLLGAICNPLGVEFECSLVDQFDYWPIIRASIASNLAIIRHKMLQDTLKSISFRSLDNGKVWLGVDEFLPIDETNVELMNDTREENYYELRAEKSTIRPGQSIYGTKIFCVRYNYSPSSSKVFAYV